MDEEAVSLSVIGEANRILLIKPSALGDVIHTLPVLAKLRKRFPHARIDWFLRPELADVVRAHPAAPEVIPFARGELNRFGRDLKVTTSFVQLLRRLRQNRYDLVIDLHGQLRSAIFGLATGAPVRIGFPPPRYTLKDLFKSRGWRGAREGSWMTYTHNLSLPTLNIHAIDRYLRVGELLGFDSEPPDLRVHVPPESCESINALLKEHQLERFALLAPGTVWETKHWDAARFAEVARELKRRGFGIILTGGGKDRPRCSAVAAAVPDALDLCGKTTAGELGALIERAAICVTNDSGPMHYAVALGRPVVSIFGPTNPVHIGPYGCPRSVVRATLPCSPCNFRRNHECPHDHQCMKTVTAQMVLERIDEILETERGIRMAQSA